MLSKLLILDSNPLSSLIAVAAIEVFFQEFFYSEVFYYKKFKNVSANDLGLFGSHANLNS